MNIISIQNANIFQGFNLILQKVNFKIKKGELVYLIGKTGTGKSSLLQTLYGDLPLQAGQGKISVVGHDASATADKKQLLIYKKNIGFLFYDPYAYTPKLSVGESLRQLLKSSGWKDVKLMDERISHVLALVGFTASKSHRSLRELSYGEKLLFQLTEIILSEAKVFLLDSILDHLDPETCDEIMCLLIKLSKDFGTTILIATHNYVLLHKFPSRILTTQKGRLIDGETLQENGHSYVQEPKRIFYVFDEQ